MGQRLRSTVEPRWRRGRRRAMRPHERRGRASWLVRLWDVVCDFGGHQVGRPDIVLDGRADRDTRRRSCSRRRHRRGKPSPRGQRRTLRLTAPRDRRGCPDGDALAVPLQLGQRRGYRNRRLRRGKSRDRRCCFYGCCGSRNSLGRRTRVRRRRSGFHGRPTRCTARDCGLGLGSCCCCPLAFRGHRLRAFVAGQGAKTTEFVSRGVGGKEKGAGLKEGVEGVKCKRRLRVGRR